MLDRTSKRFISFLQSQEDAKFMYSSDFPECLGCKSDIFATIRYLQKRELVEIIKNKNGIHIGVQLSHEARHYKEFTRANFLRYVLDHWIEFVALVVSIIAVIIACA